MTRRTRILALVISAVTVLALALVPVGRRNHRQIVAIAISPNGKIAAGTSSGQIVVWDDPYQPARETTLKKNTPLNDLHFSPDGRYLAIGGPDLIILSTLDLNARTLRTDRRNYGSVRFSQDGKRLLTISGAATIELIDIASGISNTSICCSTIYGEVAFTPDDAFLVNAGHWPRIWDLGGNRAASLTAERQFMTFRPIAFAHPDRVLMGSQDGRVYVWDLRSHALITLSPAQPRYVDTIAVLKDDWIAYAAFGDSIHLWNLVSGATRIFASAHPSSSIVFSADGNDMVFGTSSGTVEMRSATDGELVQSLKLP